MIDRFGAGLLTPAETSEHLRIPRSTLSWWLHTHAAGASLVHSIATGLRQPSVPFIGVAEAYVLRSLRSLGMRLHEIRQAAEVVRRAFDTPYGLVSKRLATDGVDIFINHGLGGVHRFRDGQVPSREAVAEQLRHLSWDVDEEFPSSLRLPQYPEAVPVVIDPRFGRGLPVIAANRVPVQAVTDLWDAGESVEDIAYEYDMTPGEVEALCETVKGALVTFPRAPAGSRGHGLSPLSLPADAD